MCLSCGLLYAYGRFKKYDYERCQCVTCTVPSKDSSDDLDVATADAARCTVGAYCNLSKLLLTDILYGKRAKAII